MGPEESNAIFDDVASFVAATIITQNNDQPIVHTIRMIDEICGSYIEIRHLVVYCDPATVLRFMAACEGSCNKGIGYRHDHHAREILLPWSVHDTLTTWLRDNRPDELPWSMTACTEDMACYVADVGLVIVPYEPMDLDVNVDMGHGIRFRTLDRIVTAIYQESGRRFRTDNEETLLSLFTDELRTFEPSNTDRSFV